ncbi:MAG: acylneuraminate cytidylyltransferase family protein [Methylotenera sp.]|nr:acylneuraminate cytidylyltransferase family protein [Methylotenera sp.]MDD4925318.1 acylneuraminate cytidylyltransferase family protein [Methylotenera sp.]
MKAVAFIFARGGSKGLPGKNIRSLGGKPLIAWSIEHALAVKRIERVIVSTDSEEIAAVAREHGAEVPFIRPAELARDDSPEWLAWRHALNYLRETDGVLPDVMVSVPTTAPLRLPLDIENCLDKYEEGDADMVITVTNANRSPYFNMVKANEDGTVGLVIPPESTIARRQDAPVVYDMATVAYVAEPEFVMTHNATFEGRVRMVHVPTERAIDIDTLLDFQIAECLLNIREQKL